MGWLVCTAASNPKLWVWVHIFSQFNSNDVFFHHELKFAMALDFQVVSSKMLQKKNVF